jgi:peptidoglycan hydrolase-like protein with peptidoglycan-binding domain
VYGGDIWTGVIPSSPTPPSAPSGGGMIVGSGPLAPSPFFFNLTPPRFQIIYPNGTVIYPAISTASTTTPASFTFSRNRQLNDEGPDILSLQRFLNVHGYQVAASGPGSPGNETDFFGTATFAALKKFQKANNVPTTGYFGPLKRALINSEVR